MYDVCVYTHCPINYIKRQCYELCANDTLSLAYSENNTIIAEIQG